MPLVHSEDINSLHRWGLWKIEESEEELIDISRPTQVEREYLQSIKHPKKRLEHLAGRCAAKTIIRDFGLADPVICNNEIGRPELCNGNMEVSISHSSHYAAAAVAQHYQVGIDVQFLESKLPEIAPRILTEEEILWANGDLQKVAILWGAKEALYKLTSKEGIDFRENLLVYGCDDGNQGTCDAAIVLDGITQPQILRFGSFFDNQYMVVVTQEQ